MILLMPGNWIPSEAHVAVLDGMVGRDRVLHATDEASACALAGEAEVVIGHRYLRQILPLAHRLRWVQTSAAGVDHLPVEALRARGVVLTRNPTNSEAIAVHVLALLLALTRRLPEAFAAQQQGHWTQPFRMLELPQNVLVLGLGGIGLAVAKRLRALGMRVIGCARTRSPERLAHCDEFIPADRWRDALGRAQALVLALPLSDDTRGMFGAAEMARLPSDSLVVNVARGGLMDIVALCDALRSGHLGGAAVDVIDPVPAVDDPLWRVPGLLITPKVSAYHPAMQSGFERFVERQLDDYLSGRPLRETVC